MNLEEVYKQIDKEADEVALVWPWGYSQADADNLVKPQPAMQINAVRRQFYIKGATPYAEKWQEAEQKNKQLTQWKREATALLDPLLEWGQSQKDMPLGCSITEELLRRAKDYTGLKERAERYEKALKDIRRWELATGKKVRVTYLDILKDIMRVVNNALTPKTSTE